MKQTRRDFILEELNKHNELRISELIALLPDVSEMTIRRDLDFLAKKGFLVRTHGGAKLLPSSPDSAYDFDTRATLNKTSKSIIAKQALSFIDNECSIFFDAGSTTLELAQNISNLKIHGITNAPNVGIELLKNPNAQVILLGGILNKSTLSVAGAIPLQELDHLNIDIAFIAASGFSLTSGFTNAYSDECSLKQKVINMAKHVIILLDISKLNRVLPFTFARVGDVHTIILNQKPPQDILEHIHTQNVQLIYP
ncbi:DeoR/GlpR family DNA-binding transcription regulator [Cellulosilyticum sp. I15G10I2]|uniref:DeoR/GlpR family DNA-binding transcription regulator n=1 Tax=Cellulosilyticum sp. I15G10I2 TaxID=1892843 RepID=UPI00085BBF3D|nr:DeoR/GlpR family DNA-binding transcription regulator [Cellulosilyticum sp. I15G10I2]